MKKILLTAVFISIFIIILGSKESRFQFVQSGSGENIEIKDDRAVVLFVGDIMLGRNVDVLMSRNGEDYPFEKISPLLSSADGVVANLEGPIMTKHILTTAMSMSFSFASTTSSLLRRYNISAVSLANNHGYDYGKKGYDETKSHLNNTGIAFMGHPYEIGTSSVARIKVQGMNVVLVGFNLTHPGFSVAGGVNFVKSIKREPGEFLVVVAHGGEEYELNSNSRQQNLYRGSVDAGADLVIAHHPHVVQEVEMYKGKPIFYSLGNFIFDQYFSKDVEHGLAVKMTLLAGEARYELIPIQSKASQPALMEGEARDAFFEELGARSPSASLMSLKKGFSVPR